MKKKVLMLVATIATVFASVMATSACFFSWYQPEQPKCLSED